MLLYSHFHGRGKLFSMQLYASSWQLHFSWIWTLKLRLSLKQLELISCRVLKMTRTTLKLSWREKSPRTTNASGPCCHAAHLLCSDPKRALHHYLQISYMWQDRVDESKALIETQIDACQEAGLDPVYPVGCGCCLLQILQIWKSEWECRRALKRWAKISCQPKCEGRTGTRTSILIGGGIFSQMPSFESSVFT